MVILIGILIAAFQCLYMIISFGINVPFWDEWDFVPTLNSFFNGDPSWIYQIFVQHNEHRIFFPNLIFLANSILTSWNLVIEMYLGWILVGITLIPIYLLLKNLDSKFTWLMLPVAVIMYSPLQWENFLWGFEITWFLMLATFVWSLYFLNNGSSGKTILCAIGLSVISSFSLILGLLIWPIGLISIAFNKEKRRLRFFAWVCSSLLVFSIYFYNYSQPRGHPIDLSFSLLPKLIQFVLNYLSGMISIPNGSFRMIISLFIFSICISSILLQKITRYKISKTIPWIQLCLFGLIAACFSAAGRISFGTDEALSSRYITVSNIFLIASLVFFCILFLILKNSIIGQKSRKILFVGFITILILGSVGMMSSYSEGWKIGYSNFITRSVSLDCVNHSVYSMKCGYLYPITADHLNDVKILQKLKLGPFVNLNQSSYNATDPLMNDDNWVNLKNTLKGFGNIDYINEPLSGQNNIFVNKTESPMVPVNGYGALSNDIHKPDSVYVLVDGKINGRAENGFLRSDIPNAYGSNITSFSGWLYVLDLQGLSNGCHKVSSLMVKGDQYYEIITNTKLCIN